MLFGAQIHGQCSTRSERVLESLQLTFQVFPELRAFKNVREKSFQSMDFFKFLLQSDKACGKYPDFEKLARVIQHDGALE